VHEDSRDVCLTPLLVQMYVLEISYCLWITMVKSPAAREMIVNGVGLRFVSVAAKYLQRQTSDSAITTIVYSA
jgi:hypothetical protein